MTTTETKQIKTWQLAIVLLLPSLYFINGLFPWSKELWVNHNRGFYIPFWASILILHWTSVLIALYFLKINHLKLRDIGYSLDMKKTLYFVGSYLLVAIGIYLFTEEGLKHVSLNYEKLNQFGDFYPRTSMERIFWILMAFTAGVCEEFIYRGFGISALTLKGINKWIALLITSVSFVFMHGHSAIISVGMFSSYLIAGLLFGGIFLWTKKLWLLMLIHMLFDLTAMMAIFGAAYK